MLVYREQTSKEIGILSLKTAWGWAWNLAISCLVFVMCASTFVKSGLSMLCSSQPSRSYMPAFPETIGLIFKVGLCVLGRE